MKSRKNNNFDNLHTPLKTRRASHIGDWNWVATRRLWISPTQCDLFISNNWCNKCDPIHIHGKAAKKSLLRLVNVEKDIQNSATFMRPEWEYPIEAHEQQAAAPLSMSACSSSAGMREGEKEKFAWAGISALRRMSEQKRRCDKTLLIICIMLKFQEKELFFTLFRESALWPAWMSRRFGDMHTHICVENWTWWWWLIV